MKYKITLNDSIELLVVADSEVEAVKKAREVKSKLDNSCNLSDSNLDKLIDWYTGLNEEEVDESLEAEGWKRIDFERLSNGHICIWQKGSDKIAVTYINERAMKIRKK